MTTDKMFDLPPADEPKEPVVPFSGMPLPDDYLYEDKDELARQPFEKPIDLPETVEDGGSPLEPATELSEPQPPEAPHEVPDRGDLPYPKNMLRDADLPTTGPVILKDRPATKEEIDKVWRDGEGNARNPGDVRT